MNQPSPGMNSKKFTAKLTFTWNEFEEVYRKAHIPASVIKIKQQEFLALNQGNLSIGEYLTKFNNLSCFAPADVDTDEKKKDRFLHGMHQTLKTQLSVLQFPDFQALINTALIAEKEHRYVYDTHKRKFETRKDRREGASTKQRTWQANPPAPALATTEIQPKREGYPRSEFYNKRPIMDDCKRDNA